MNANIKRNERGIAHNSCAWIHITRNPSHNNMAPKTHNKNVMQFLIWKLTRIMAMKKKLRDDNEHYWQMIFIISFLFSSGNEHFFDPNFIYIQRYNISYSWRRQHPTTTTEYTAKSEFYEWLILRLVTNYSRVPTTTTTAAALEVWIHKGTSVVGATPQIFDVIW